jgi:hypothetical protein
VQRDDCSDQALEVPFVLVWLNFCLIPDTSRHGWVGFVLDVVVLSKLTLGELKA